jgi:hypothetical protein
MGRCLQKFTPILAFTGMIVTLSALGKVLRFSLGRAIVLALSSRFARMTELVSIRKIQLSILREKIREKNWKPSYVVVTGEKRIGKSCLIDSTISKTSGVVKISAFPGDDQNLLIERALREVTNLRTLTFDFASNAKRVIKWYKFLTFNKTPILVISATERKANDKHANLTGAVRKLTEDYQLKVIIDSSPNSLDPVILSTYRQDILEVSSMTKEEIWELPQFAQLFMLIDKANLGNMVWSVLGGVPGNFESIK